MKRLLLYLSHPCVDHAECVPSDPDCMPPVSEHSNLGPTLVLPLKAVPVLSPSVEETGFLLMMPETDTGTTE